MSTAWRRGAAGYIDRTRSIMMHAPNIDWHDVCCARSLRNASRPVTLENDANAAGWGDRFAGGTSDMVMVTLGTGVGGAVIADGTLVIGANGQRGAELGHLRFVRGGRPCGCGQNGCLEQYASGRRCSASLGDIADAGGIGERLAAHRAPTVLVHGSSACPAERGR
ncbi:MAG: ROK family protein [Microbacterium sp.]